MTAKSSVGTGEVSKPSPRCLCYLSNFVVFCNDCKIERNLFTIVENCDIMHTIVFYLGGASIGDHLQTIYFDGRTATKYPKCTRNDRDKP